MEVKSKAFLELILLHSKNPKRTKELLKKDRRLTQDERNIVRGFLLVRDNANLKAYQLAKSLAPQIDPIVRSMHLYLLGTTLNNQGKYHDALQSFQECYQILPKGVSVHLEYVILNNLFVIYMNLHFVAEAREILTIMQTMEGLNQKHLLRLKRLRFNFYTATENRDLADSIYRDLILNKDQFEDHDRIALLTHFYHYGIVFDHLEICSEALNELRDQKKYALTQIYNYMKILLAHLQERAPIYLYEPDFKDYPVLMTELKFIRALDQHKLSELPELWATLQKSNPSAFRDHYEFHGFKNAFSRCLHLHIEKLKQSEVKTVRESTLSILDAIEQKLNNDEYVSKEQLFYYVYGRELEGKDDHNRISKHVNKLKTTKNLEIRSIRGAYHLVKKSS